MVGDSLRPTVTRILNPVAGLFARFHIHPNILSWVGGILSIPVCVFFAAGRFRWAGLFLIMSGFFDILDGQVARYTKQTSRFGAFLDSSLDRFTEVVVFLGLIYFYIQQEQPLAIILCYLVITGSLLISYVKARAEGLDQDCKVGLLERPERIIMIILGALIGSDLFIYVLWLMAIFTHFTVLQRISYVWQQMRHD